MRSLDRERAAVPGIPMREVEQLALLRTFQSFYTELPFPERPQAGSRYYFDQAWFGCGDAVVLYSWLRAFAPRRVIEVGSGFSSALMLDTIDRFAPGTVEFTFIDPHPERVRTLLRGRESDRDRIVASRLQDVPLEMFDALEPGDLLFIDSSHVVKCGSDLHRVMFEILPRLRRGVFVHFHDVFYPFEYPAEWLEEGRYWNENYFLRAFLTDNPAWTVVYFNDYVALMHRDEVAARLPLCLRNPGGSLYLRRV
jgi:predicted O-methyltransferase YrrM